MTVRSDLLSVSKPVVLDPGYRGVQSVGRNAMTDPRMSARGGRFTNGHVRVSGNNTMTVTCSL